MNCGGPNGPDASWEGPLLTKDDMGIFPPIAELHPNWSLADTSFSHSLSTTVPTGWPLMQLMSQYILTAKNMPHAMRPVSKLLWAIL